MSDEYPGGFHIHEPIQPIQPSHNPQTSQPEAPPQEQSSQQQQQIMKSVMKILPNLVDPERHDDAYADGTARVFDAILQHLKVQYEPVNVSHPRSKKILWDLLIDAVRRS